MTHSIFCIGKTNSDFIVNGCAEYEKRLRYYGAFVWHYLPDIKNGASLPKELLLQKEGELFLDQCSNADTIVLLDAGGRQFTSPEFAKFIQKSANTSTKRLCFFIGGAYGFSSSVRSRAAWSISLSPMTFPHDLVRLIFIEQLYRAMTILRGEKYHHE